MKVEPEAGESAPGESAIVQWLEQPVLDNPVSNALLSAVPIVGGPLQTLISAELQRIKSRKWRAFAVLVEQRLSKLEEKDVDLDEIRSDEFLSRFQRLCGEVTDRSDAAKLKYLQSYLINSLFRNGPDTTTKEVFFSYIQRCTGAHLTLLGIFHSLQGHLSFADRFSLPKSTASVPLTIDYLCTRVPQFDRRLLMMLMNDLEAIGLVRLWHDTDSAGGWSISEAGLAFFLFVKPTEGSVT